MTIARRIQALDLTPETTRAFGALASAPSSMRYRLLQQAFVEQGVEGWDCPAMREL